EVIPEITKKYQTYNDIINMLVDGKDPFEGLKINAKFATAMKEIVAKNIKPKIYTVSYIAQVSVYNTKAGISLIKKAFTEIEKLGVTVLYLGAPRYRMVSEDMSYPKAEDRIKKANDILEKELKNSSIELIKEKIKDA
ncbi:MAG: hypothetical protein KGH71_02005, partial [Candidatus Micrarchaeota archaeon]|nr:hypothetical protein [Candidatus Micrarchaeota archaeon]